jgi:hypothetical protein
MTGFNLVVDADYLCIDRGIFFHIHINDFRIIAADN